MLLRRSLDAACRVHLFVDTQVGRSVCLGGAMTDHKPFNWPSLVISGDVGRPAGKGRGRSGASAAGGAPRVSGQQQQVEPAAGAGYSPRCREPTLRSCPTP